MAKWGSLLQGLSLVAIKVLGRNEVLSEGSTGKAHFEAHMTVGRI
jgi:hypothetical protein